MLAQLLIRAAATASAGFKFEPTISADTINYNLRAAAVSAGWNQTDSLIATVTINSGIVVSSNNTGIPAFDTGSTFPAGSQLRLVNNGYVCGMGGAGADGSADMAGYPGGPALTARFALAVTNSQVLAGGGGGGALGGGGGRTGRVNSAAGLFGSPGTFASGGNGIGDNLGGTTGPADHGGYQPAGGGGWGAAGGTSLWSPEYGEAVLTVPGGAGGASVTGNSYITWLATGTRYGAIT